MAHRGSASDLEVRRILVEAVVSTLPIDDVPLSSLGATTDGLLAAFAEALAAQTNLRPTAFRLRSTDTLGDLLETLAQQAGSFFGREPTDVDWPAIAEAKVADLVASASQPPPGLYSRPSYDRHILLTGAACPIGCALLETLTKDDADVDKITCLVPETTDERALASLLQHLTLSGYDVPRFYAAGVELEVLAVDPRHPNWGLNSSDKERLSGGVTDVVAADWRSDADESLAAYEQACVRPTLDLFNFCAAGRLKAFHWLTTSRLHDSQPTSIASATHDGWSSVDPKMAGSSPFVRSQWLMETVLHQLALLDHPVPVIIHRIGDLSAHSRTGRWDPAAAIPRMLRISLRVGRLPRLEGFRPAWQSPDLIAETVKRSLLRDTDSCNVVDHRRPATATDWTNYLEVIAGLGICSGPFDDSVEKWGKLAEQVGRSTTTPPTPVGLLEELKKLETCASAGSYPAPTGAGRSRSEMTDEVRAWFLAWTDGDDE